MRLEKLEELLGSYEMSRPDYDDTMLSWYENGCHLCVFSMLSGSTKDLNNIDYVEVEHQNGKSTEIYNYAEIEHFLKNGMTIQDYKNEFFEINFTSKGFIKVITEERKVMDEVIDFIHRSSIGENCIPISYNDESSILFKENTIIFNTEDHFLVNALYALTLGKLILKEHNKDLTQYYSDIEDIFNKADFYEYIDSNNYNYEFFSMSPFDNRFIREIQNKNDYIGISMERLKEFSL